jgi:hypothetical protein
VLCLIAKHHSNAEPINIILPEYQKRTMKNYFMWNMQRTRRMQWQTSSV